jgi:hypothetical protein
MQKGVLTCSSGTVKKEHLQENWDLGKLWTTEEIDRRPQEDDPPCNSGMGQGKYLQEGLDQEPGKTRNPETMKIQGKTVERSGMQQWHKGPRAETAATRQNEDKGPMQRMTTIFEEGEDNHKWHWRVELRMAITCGKRRNAQEDPVCDIQRENCRTSRQNL